MRRPIPALLAATAALGLLALPASAAPTEPPYGGTIFIDPDILTADDPTTFVDVRFAGRGLRTVFDRRTDSFVEIDAFLFAVRFSDRPTVEGIVNPEFGDAATAQAALEAYLPDLGRVPAVLRTDMDEIWVHAGDESWGGGNRSILIHTGQGDDYDTDGIVAETVVHELAHTSLDETHAAAPGWLAAQASDPTFISTYARDNPDREDIAETFLNWLAVRHTPDRIDDAYRTNTTEAVPARLAYFDGVDLDLSPVVPTDALGEPLAGFDGDPSRSGLLDAADPTAVSLAISTLRHPVPGTADRAVLGRDDTHPDSLAAAALTADAPLLFTARDGLEDAVAAELQRVLAPGATVDLLGGDAALSAAVADQVTALGFVPNRISGANRIATALAVADRIAAAGPVTRVALARSHPSAGDATGTSGWADSVTGGAWAAEAGLPVLITRTGELDPGVLAWLQDHGVTHVDVLGGAAAVSDTVVADLAAAGIEVRRISGATRVETSVEIAEQLWGQAPAGPRRHVVIPGLSGTGWAAGLAAAGLAAHWDAPLLAANPNASSADFAEALSSCPGPEVDVVFVGDARALSTTGTAGDEAWMRSVEALDGACAP